MDVEQIAAEYRSWEDYETEPSEELQRGLVSIRSKPSENSDLFFSKIVSDFSEEKDIFWLDQAIKYSQYASDKVLAVRYLEKIVSDPARFGFIGGLLGAAASHIGMLAEYPNETLSKILSGEIDLSSLKTSIAHDLRSSAYGAYIMTGTDFSTGLQAGREAKSSTDIPNLISADQFISKWKQS